MSNDMILKAQLRVNTGSSAARRLRREGELPAALSTSAGDVVLLKLNAHDFRVLLQHHQSESLLVKLDVEGRGQFNALMLEVQHNNLTGRSEHVEFAEVKMDEKITATISVAVTGEAEGVRNAGGILDHQLHEVEVECLPGDLVEELTVDVTELGIGDSLLVQDIDFGGKLEPMIEPDQVVAVVVLPAAEEEEEEEGEEAEDAEPEVIGEKQEESEEEEA